ncbi:required for meiotic nuclear division protein 1 homolog isoform X1 [Mya arenaria]|uniref:required for meiotic nuclear division protein 1 homolog isoform X1 n=1 Tax=Mya arenaria TaxID=6604 RepID=UPI0022E98693|nr:required for meiotic nuclear division protein 1 homolog isoform X1 [Mya arenaria]XP_052801408.1 required for meiotic nuclear division protein 1 homolog isoform X1 [Mya arenaria]
MLKAGFRSWLPILDANLIKIVSSKTIRLLHCIKHDPAASNLVAGAQPHASVLRRTSVLKRNYVGLVQNIQHMSTTSGNNNINIKRQSFCDISNESVCLNCIQRWKLTARTIGHNNNLESSLHLWRELGQRRNYVTSAKIGNLETPKISLRKLKKSKLKPTPEEDLHHNHVVAYSVANSLNLDTLAEEIIAEDTYTIVQVPAELKEDMPDVVMVTAKYKFEGQIRDAFFFRNGSIALWTMSESEVRNKKHDLLLLARRHSIKPHSHILMEQEAESIPLHSDSVSKLVKGTIHVRPLAEGGDIEEGLILEKFAFSNAMAQSVTLAINESKLEDFIEKLEDETEKLRDGKPSDLKKRDINMRLGEVFYHRHEINLESGFLDTPDVYWEREDLEPLYRETFNYLSVSKRIKVYNERLSYCSEILQLLSSQQNDAHHVRLEWIIIILILIEVMFECLHYAEKFGWIRIGPTEMVEDQTRGDDSS